MNDKFDLKKIQYENHLVFRFQKSSFFNLTLFQILEILSHCIKHLFLLFCSFFLTLCLDQRTYHWLFLKYCLHWNCYFYGAFTYCLNHFPSYNVKSVRVRGSLIMNVGVNYVFIFRNDKQFLNLIWLCFTWHKRYSFFLKF